MNFNAGGEGDVDGSANHMVATNAKNKDGVRNQPNQMVSKQMV